MADQLPQGWIPTVLGDVCTNPQYGYTTKAANTGTTRLLRTTDITSGNIDWKTVPFCSVSPSEPEKYLLFDGDIVISRAGSVGVSILIKKPQKAVFASYLIRFKPLVDKIFFQYFLQCPVYWSQISENKLGIAVPNINASKLNKIKLLLPPLNEQKRIVAKIEELFSELDNGIAALKTAREQLKVYRQAVLKNAFEGKLTAKWREENADKLESPEQLLARIQQERETRYQQQLEEWKLAVKKWEEDGKEGKKPGKPAKISKIQCVADDELPSLPNGWLWIEYAGICERIRNGISAKPSGEAGEKIFRISAVRAMEFDLNDIRYLQDSDGQYTDYFLTKGDLVFTRYNGTRDYVGVCAEYRGDGSHLYPDKLIQTRIAVSSISPSFLEKAINSGGSRHFLEKRIRTTAGQSGISGGDIKAMPVPVCSLSEQAIIEQHIDTQFSGISAIEQEIEKGLKKSETLRQSILKKAFSGQLVPQDPDDEPASELLARIKAEKEAAAAAEKAKKATNKKPAAKRGRKPKGDAA